MLTVPCNFILLGKTGVGKSSLLKYLTGDNLTQPPPLTGAGKPVTEKGFHKYSMHMRDTEVNVYDSWGLEVGKIDEWKSELDKFIDERGVDKEIRFWGHLFVYCVSDHRITDGELDIIEKLLTHGYKVTVAITKTDGMTDEELATMTKRVTSFNQSIPVIPINSVSDSSGFLEGKDELWNVIFQQWKKSIAHRLPKRITHRAKLSVLEIKKEVGKYLQSKSVSCFSNDDLHKDLYYKWKVLQDRFVQYEYPKIAAEEIEACNNIGLPKILNNSAMSCSPTSPKSTTSNSELSAWELPLFIPIAIVAAPILIVGGLFKGLLGIGKDDEIQKCYDLISDWSNKLVEHLDQSEISVRESFENVV